MRARWGSVVATSVLLPPLGACSPAPDVTIPETVVALADLDVTPGSEFVHVRDVVVDGDRTWVLDASEPFITRIDGRGSSFLRFGSEGSGPGELVNAWALEVSRPEDDGRVVVWDLGTGRVSAFHEDGALAFSQRIVDSGMSKARRNIRSVTYGDPFRVRKAGNRYVFGRYGGSVALTRDLRVGELMGAADPALASTGPVTGLGDATQAPESWQMDELGAVPLWDACADGSLVVWDPGAGVLRWTDSAGRTRREEALPLSARPLSTTDVERYLRWRARLELGPGADELEIDIAAMARTERRHFAEVAPIATDLRCGAAREAWLRLFDTSHDPLGHGPSWITLGGPSTEIFTFPPAFSPIVFVEDAVVGVLEDPGGLQRLARWRRSLVLP